MHARRAFVLTAGVLLVAAAVFLDTRGPAPATPNAPGTFSFALLGDAPYYPWEELQYRQVLQDLNQHDLTFVLHVGDIFWRPCSDDHYATELEWLNHVRHPVVYTPGDNEWTDCWEEGSGGFRPLERLGRIRAVFFAVPGRSLGGSPRALESQGAGAAFPEFVENARWYDHGIVFATVDIVGSTNGMRAFPGRTAEDDQAARRRTDAAAAWVREAFAVARARSAPAIVIAFHADVGFRAPPGDRHRQAFEPFLEVLEEEAAGFDGPVLIAHGDGHVYTVDHPIVQRGSGVRLEHVTRLEVPGSPRVGWVRVVVTPGARNPFAFSERVVPRWKYW